MQYAPSIHRFIWMLQGNGYRIATASPADIISSHGTAWTYWNLTPDIFNGFPNENLDTKLDYPDMSLVNGAAYLSWNAGVGCACPCDWGHQVARISLAELGAGGTITISYTDPGDGRNAWGTKLTQNTGNAVFWAGHNDNSHVRVFSFWGNRCCYSWRDVGISSWSTTGLSSTTPDGKGWLTKLAHFPNTAVIGGTRVGNLVGFGWSAGTDSHFLQPHVEIVTLDSARSFTQTQQVQIWNNDCAFVYSAFATNVCTNEVGLSLEYRGNGHYENHVVGFWGNFVLYITTNSNVGTTRFSDYLTIRQARQPARIREICSPLMATDSGILRHQLPTRRPISATVFFGRPARSCNILE